MKTRTKHFNKFFSFLLAMLLVVGMLPTTVFAETPTDSSLPRPTNLRWDGNFIDCDIPSEASGYAIFLQGYIGTERVAYNAYNSGQSPTPRRDVSAAIEYMESLGSDWMLYFTARAEYERTDEEGNIVTVYSESAISPMKTGPGYLGLSQVTSVAVGYTGFVAGQPIANAIPTTATTGVSVSNYEWKVNGSGTLGANFEAGTNYSLTIYLKAADGYALDGLNNDSITVNGAKPYSSGKTEGTQTSKGDYMIVVYPGTPEVNAPTEYSIKVNSGKATIGAGNEVTKAKENDVITITANAASEGKVFDKWEVVSGSVTLADANAKETTFTMPGEAVEVTATYKEAVSLSKVTSVAVDYTGFVAGQLIANAIPTTATTGVSVSNYEWAVNGSGALGANFDADTNYRLTIYLKAADGYTLDELTNDSITVNGAKPYSSGKTQGTQTSKGDYMIVVYPGTPEVNAPTEYTIKVNSGKATIGAGNEVTKAKENDVITITANAAPEGKKFAGWTVVSGTVTLADASAESTTFTMPGEAVEVTATYKEEASSSKVTSVAVDYTGFVAGQPIANAIPTTATTGVSVSNYEWAVNGSGTLGANFDADTNYRLTIYLKAADGYALDELTNDSITVNGAKPYSSGKTMGTDVAKGDYQIVVYPGTPEVNAPTEYSIKVNSGKATIGAGNEVTKAKENDVITITANAAPEGKVFNKWEVGSGSVTLADATAKSTTFTMPGEAVEVTATYKEAASSSKVTSVAVGYTGFVAGQPIANAIPTTATTGVSVSNYEWAVNGSGTLGANFEADTDYKLTIYLKAADGYALDELTNDSITVNGAKPYSSGKTMGTDVAKGDYQIVVYPGTPEVNAPTEYSIKVNSGKATIGAGSEIDKAKENDVVTITANAAPEGKEFDKWEVGSGSVTLADATAKSTTFTMPCEAVEVTATYKDKTVTPPAPVTYTITKGNGQTVTKGNTANFVSDASFDKFVKVQVDGADVAASNYKAVSGSTDVTFNTYYINSLSEGNHTIAIVSNDGQATGSFTVKAASVTPPHSHNFGTEWKSDADNHWKECSCGEKSEQAAHNFKWVIDKEATKDKDGSKHEECTVCGYKKDAVKIPATGNDKPTEPTKPTDPTKPTKPTDSTSPKTGDTSNILLWFAIFFISGGAATVLGIKSKKRKVQE